MANVTEPFVIDLENASFPQQIWSFLWRQFDPFTLTTFLPFTVLVGTYILGNIPLMTLELMDFEFLRKYKIQPTKYNDKAFTIKCIKQLLFNYFCVMLPMEMMSFKAFLLLGFEVSERLPSLITVLTQLAICFVVEDFVHYWFHRWLHHPKIYRQIHAIHHEFRAPYGISASYAHPIEVVVLGFATFAGPFIIRPHLAVFLLWVNLRQFSAIETHAGYTFPFSPAELLPFVGGADFHDWHHKTINGNYSSNFRYLDIIFGTDTTYRQKQKKIAAEKAAGSSSPSIKSEMPVPPTPQVSEAENSSEEEQKEQKPVQEVQSAPVETVQQPAVVEEAQTLKPRYVTRRSVMKKD